MKLLATIILLASGLTALAQMDYSPGFDAGKPPEMAQLAFLEGSWEVTLKWTGDMSLDKSEWPVIGQTRSEFTDVYDGAFVMEVSDGFPIGDHEGFSHWRYTSIYSYDRFQQKFRCVVLDNLLALEDIYEGDFSDAGFLLSNENTATYNNHGENQSAQKNKFLIQQLSDSLFELTWFNIDHDKLLAAGDGEVEWDFAIYMLYEKQTE